MKFNSSATSRYAVILPRRDNADMKNIAQEAQEVLKANKALAYNLPLMPKGLEPPPPVVSPTIGMDGANVISSFAPYMSTCSNQGMTLTHHHHAQNPPVQSTTVSLVLSSSSVDSSCPESPSRACSGTALRLNKFVRRLHDMLVKESKQGVVDWRKGLLVLHNTGSFAKKILPKYFNTRNFKTFRRQLNYYGFVHVRSFVVDGKAYDDASPPDSNSSTTALWVNQELAKNGTDEISSVLLLRRVSPGASVKTAEGRRIRKKEAFCQIEDNLNGVVSIAAVPPAVTRLPTPPATFTDSLHPRSLPQVEFVQQAPSRACWATPFPDLQETVQSLPTNKQVHQIPDQDPKQSYTLSPDGEAAQLLLMFSNSRPILSS